MCKRFAETIGEEVIKTFSKIKQKGEVSEHQELFEELKAQVMMALPHLPESYYISICTSGLREEIKSTVKIMKPHSLAQAFEIALYKNQPSMPYPEIPDFRNQPYLKKLTPLRNQTSHTLRTSTLP